MASRSLLPILSAPCEDRESIELWATGLNQPGKLLALDISKSHGRVNHVKHIFSKTGARKRSPCCNWAMDHGKICRDGFNCCNLPLTSTSLKAPIQQSRTQMMQEL